MALSNLFNYGADPIWGNAFNQAQSSGNTALAQRYQGIIDASYTPEHDKQVGGIQAKMLDMGRNLPTSTSSISPHTGLEYNLSGQARMASPAQTYNPFPSGGVTWGSQPQQNPWQAPPVTSPTPVNTSNMSSSPAWGTGGLGNLYNVNRDPWNSTNSSSTGSQQSVDYNNPDFWNNIFKEMGWVK